MVKVIWTQRSLDDLFDIAEFIAKDSSKYAGLTIEKILSVESMISTSPFIGKVVTETDTDKIRQLIKGSYRIIYKIENEMTVYILTIFHSARLLKGNEIENIDFS